MNLKQKNILLLVGLVILFWISYHFSFSKAFEAKEKYELLKNKEKILKDIPSQIVKMKKESKHLDSLLSKNQLSFRSSFQSDFLQFLSSSAKQNDLEIISFSQPHKFSKGESVIITYAFSIKGSYTSIIKLIYNLEQINKFGNILSVEFEKKKNFRTNQYFLTSSILLQRTQKIGSIPKSVY